MASDESASRQQQRMLGWGLRSAPVFPTLDIGQDLVFAAGGFERVQGIDNLAQDLGLALTTALGSDPFDVSLGFDGINAIAEERDPLLARERVRISVIKVLRRDPRVRRILDVKLFDGRLSSAGERDPAADPQAPRNALAVQVAFEIVSGQEVSIKLGGLPIHV